MTNTVNPTANSLTDYFAKMVRDNKPRGSGAPMYNRLEKSGYIPVAYTQPLLIQSSPMPKMYKGKQFPRKAHSHSRGRRVKKSKVKKRTAANRRIKKPAPPGNKNKSKVGRKLSLKAAKRRSRNQARDIFDLQR